MLKNVARRDHQPGLAGAADQLDRADAVATKVEEAVVDGDLLQPKHLGEQRRQHFLLRRAWQASGARGKVRRRQGATVQLAVRRQRQRGKHHDRRRHHVVRQAGAQRPAQRRGIGAGPRPGGDVADQLLVSRLVLARDHRRLRHTGLAAERRRDLARLDAEAADLHLVIGAAEEVQHPVQTPARQIAGAVHPRARRAERAGHKALRRQARAVQIAPRQTRSGNVEFTRNANRHRTQTPIQNMLTARSAMFQIVQPSWCLAGPESLRQEPAA